MHAIRVTTTGGPEALEWAETDEPTPKPGDLTVELRAAGLNYIDTYHRGGLYPMPLPFTPGVEGSGTVTAVGPEAEGFSVGDRVAWTGVIGSYAETVAVPASSAVPVPDGVDLELAAGVLLQGMTAHMLATDCWPLAEGERCLIHAGAGGVGLLLIQMAKMRGAEVFSTVGSPEKAELVTAAGADHVILYRDVDFGDSVEAIAGKRALDVVYDGVGADTFDRSLELLRPRGLMVTYGNASGPVEPVLPLRLMQGGSLYLTRPTLGDYTATRADLERRSGDLFRWIAEGSLDFRVGARVPLSDAAEAHRMIEGRQTTGKVLLVRS